MSDYFSQDIVILEKDHTNDSDAVSENSVKAALKRKQAPADILNTEDTPIMPPTVEAQSTSSRPTPDDRSHLEAPVLTTSPIVEPQLTSNSPGGSNHEIPVSARIRVYSETAPSESGNHDFEPTPGDQNNSLPSSFDLIPTHSGNSTSDVPSTENHASLQSVGTPIFLDHPANDDKGTFENAGFFPGPPTDANVVVSNITPLVSEAVVKAPAIEGVEVISTENGPTIQATSSSLNTKGSNGKSDVERKKTGNQKPSKKSEHSQQKPDLHPRGFSSETESSDGPSFVYVKVPAGRTPGGMYFNRSPDRAATRYVAVTEDMHSSRDIKNQQHSRSRSHPKKSKQDISSTQYSTDHYYSNGRSGHKMSAGPRWGGKGSVPFSRFVRASEDSLTSSEESLGQRKSRCSHGLAQKIVLVTVGILLLSAAVVAIVITQAFADKPASAAGVLDQFPPCTVTCQGVNISSTYGGRVTLNIKGSLQDLTFRSPLQSRLALYELAEDVNAKFSVDATCHTTFGLMLTCINNECASLEDKTYWQIRVNGQPGQYGISCIFPVNGDSIDFILKSWDHR